jgi:hypothetical protein
VSDPGKSVPLIVHALRTRPDFDAELEWYWNRAESDMGARSTFPAQLGARAPHAPPPAPDEVVEFAHAYRRIRGWLRAVPGMHVGVLKAAYEVAPWPETLYDELGRLTGIAVRLACAAAGAECPADDWKRRELLLARARALSMECARCRGSSHSPVLHLKRDAERLFGKASLAYAKARGKTRCVVRWR